MEPLGYVIVSLLVLWLIAWGLSTLFSDSRTRMIVRADSPLEAINSPGLPKLNEPWPHEDSPLVSRVIATELEDGYWEIQVEYDGVRE